MEVLNENIGDEYLDIFDNITISEKKERRRVALYTMENFYSIVMATVGERALNCQNEIYQGNLGEQWSDVRSKLQEFISENEQSTVDEYAGIIRGRLKDKRDNAYHHFDEGVSENALQRFREIAEDFRCWLLEKAEEYQEKHGAYSASEFLEAKKNIEDAARHSNRYQWACEVLYKELEYVERVTLKQED